MAKSVFDWLDHHGMGNVGFDYDGKPREKKELEALCYSYDCTKDKMARKIAIKKVPLTATDCADCGSALFWRTKRPKRNR